MTSEEEQKQPEQEAGAYEHTFNTSDRLAEITRKKKAVQQPAKEGTLDMYEGTEHEIKPTPKEEADLIAATAQKLVEKISDGTSDRATRHIWTAEEEEKLEGWINPNFQKVKPSALAVIIAPNFKHISVRALESKIYVLRRAKKVKQEQKNSTDSGLEKSTQITENDKNAEKEPWEEGKPTKVYYSAEEVPDDNEPLILNKVIIPAGPFIGSMLADIEITGDFKIRVIKTYIPNHEKVTIIDSIKPDADKL